MNQSNFPRANTLKSAYNEFFQKALAEITT